MARIKLVFPLLFVPVMTVSPSMTTVASSMDWKFCTRTVTAI
jgi:hypothetical protein